VGPYAPRMCRGNETLRDTQASHGRHTSAEMLSGRSAASAYGGCTRTRSASHESSGYRCRRRPSTQQQQQHSMHLLTARVHGGECGD
jgi:hypothetical protein